VGDLRGARLARHLEHHGIKLGIRVVHTHGLKVSEILLREVARSDADLMVMGGYGHTRLREWVLGGATRDLLHRTSIPLLLAH
jgi:nucleotide-binding universal stress UspA family protein